MTRFIRYVIGLGLAGWCIFIYGWSLLLMSVPTVFTNDPAKLRLIRQGTVDFLTTSNGLIDLGSMLVGPTIAGVFSYFLLKPLFTPSEDE